MKGYKGFQKGLICRGKQYAENTIFEENSAEICKSGMHFCKNPFDVLDYYPLVDENGEFSEFATVNALAKSETDDKKKYCTKKLKVGVKLGFAGFIKAGIDFLYEKTIKKAPNDSTSGYSAKIGSSGDYAQIGSSGYSAKINSTGKHAVIMCAGNGSIAKGKIGSWITLAEWKIIDEECVPVCVMTKKIDGIEIKEDTFYRLINGKFEEVQE